MDEKEMLEQMVGKIEQVPERVEVLGLRQIPAGELEARARGILGECGKVFKVKLEGGSDRVVEADRTLIRLARGARLVIYHNSGAMRYTSGLAPLERLFEKIETREALVKLVERKVSRLNTKEWLGAGQRLVFENLWQVKASAADRSNKSVPLVLCRVVGAYRHFVGELPVWGAASFAVKLAAAGALDVLDLQVCQTNHEVIDEVEVLRPEQAARALLGQMATLWSGGKFSPGEFVEQASLRFGYFSLPKRKTQRLLAPVYVAAIQTGGDEPMARQFILAASEKNYLPVCELGTDPRQALLSRAGG